MANAPGQLEMTEEVPVSTAGDQVPSAGLGKLILFSSGGLWYSKDGGGVVTLLNNQVANGSVTNAMLADMAQATLKGRAAGAGTGVPTDLTAAQAKVILDLTGTNSGDQTFTASGDATAPGSASNLALTLATVNGNVGSFGSNTSIPTVTVNGKGLITAASAAAVLTTPAGQTPVGATRTITATSPVLIDGGTSADLSANRTLSLLTSPTGQTPVGVSRLITATSPVLIDGGASADLSANRTLSLLTSPTGQTPVGVTRQVGTTSPLTGGGPLSADLSLAIQAASDIQDGYLTAANFKKLANVWYDATTDFGVNNLDKTGATDNTSKIDAIITAMPVGGVLYFPPGTYDTNGGHTINKALIIMGAGRSVSVINCTHATNTVFTLQSGAGGLGFEQIRISADTAALRTAGYAVDFGPAVNAYMQQCDILFHWSGVHSSAGLQFLDDMNIREMGANASNGAAVLIDGTGDRYLRRLTTDNPSDPTGFAAVRARACASLVITDCNLINGNFALDIAPVGVVASVLSTGTFYDSSNIGVRIVPSSNSDTAHRIRFVNCWFGSNATAGVQINDPTTPINAENINSVDFIGCDFFGSAAQPQGRGLDVNGCAEWRIQGCRISGSTNEGVRVQVGNMASTHSFTVSDSIIGLALGTGIPNGAGITVGAGTYLRYQITDNRGLNTNTTPGISDLGTVNAPNEKVIRDNLGTGLNTYEAGSKVTFTMSTTSVVVAQFPIVQPNLVYGFDAQLHAHIAATNTAGVGVGIVLPAGATMEATAVGPQSTVATAVRTAYFTAGNTPQNSFITTTGLTGQIRVSGAIIAGTATSHTGMVQLIARAGTTATVRAGSWFRGLRL